MPEQKLTTFKAFDADLSCRGHKFEVGGTYTVSGRIVACRNGFHACENPFDVWRHYPLIDGAGHFSRYAEVEQTGDLNRHGEDSKVASASITIKAELKLPDFVPRMVRWLIDSVSSAVNNEKADDDDAQLASSGNGAQLASSGYDAQLASSGNGAQLASSGYGARLASSGNDAQLASSGNGAQLASSGYDARLASSGYDARLASSGNGAQLASSGEDGVIASSGRNSKAKGAAETWISLAEFDDEGRCVGFATGCIGRDGLEPDVWHRAEGGRLVAIRT